MEELMREQYYLDQLDCRPFNIKVLIYKGKGIIDAVWVAKTKLLWWSPQLILVLNGLCDVTQLERQTRLVSLRNNEARAILEYKESMDIVCHHLRILFDRNPTQVISQIVGLDIAKHNGEVLPSPQEEELDSTINSINVEINKFNSANNTISPWLARDIHKNTKGHKKTRYYKLGEDGVHLTQDLQQRWASEILASLHKNHEKLMETAHWNYKALQYHHSGNHGHLLESITLIWGTLLLESGPRKGTAAKYCT